MSYTAYFQACIMKWQSCLSVVVDDDDDDDEASSYAKTFQDNDEYWTKSPANIIKQSLCE